MQCSYRIAFLRQKIDQARENRLVPWCTIVMSTIWCVRTSNRRAHGTIDPRAAMLRILCCVFVVWRCCCCCVLTFGMLLGIVLSMRAIWVRAPQANRWWWLQWRIGHVWNYMHVVHLHDVRAAPLMHSIFRAYYTDNIHTLAYVAVYAHIYLHVMHGNIYIYNIRSAADMQNGAVELFSLCCVCVCVYFPFPSVEFSTACWCRLCAVAGLGCYGLDWETQAIFKPFIMKEDCCKTGLVDL